MKLPLDLRSVSDGDLERLISQLVKRETQISRERRLLHEYLELLGVERDAQTTGIPLDGWLGTLATRENEVSYERSLVQGRLDILRAEQTERKNGGSLASPRVEQLTEALSRHSRRSATSQRRLNALP